MLHDKLFERTQNLIKRLELMQGTTDCGHIYTALQSSIEEVSAELKNLEGLQDDYWNEVESVAKALVSNIDYGEEDEDALRNQFDEAVHEFQNSHPWLLDYDLAVFILQISEYPCAEFFEYGDGFMDDLSGDMANMPWSTFASAAMLRDVLAEIHDLYDVDCINDETLREIYKKHLKDNEDTDEQ